MRFLPYSRPRGALFGRRARHRRSEKSNKTQDPLAPLSRHTGGNISGCLGGALSWLHLTTLMPLCPSAFASWARSGDLPTSSLHEPENIVEMFGESCNCVSAIEKHPRA